MQRDFEKFPTFNTTSMEVMYVRKFQVKFRLV